MSDDTKTNGIKDLLATAGVSTADKPKDDALEINIGYYQHDLKIDTEVEDLMHELLTLQSFVLSMHELMNGQMPVPKITEQPKKFWALMSEFKKDYPSYTEEQKHDYWCRHQQFPEYAERDEKFIKKAFPIEWQLKYYRRKARLQEIQNKFVEWGCDFVDVLKISWKDLPAHKLEFNILDDDYSKVMFQSETYQFEGAVQRNFIRHLNDMHKIGKIPVSTANLRDALNIDYSPSTYFLIDKENAIYHPAWGTLILQPKQGYYQLNIKVQPTPNS